MKKSLFKSLFLAVALLTGGSINLWADATVIYGRSVTADAGNGYVAWSTEDITENAWTGSVSFASVTEAGLNIQNNSNANTSEVITNSSISYHKNAILTYDIVWDNGESYQHDANYTYLSIGDGIQFRAYSQAQKGEVVIGNVSISIPNACNNSNGNRAGDVWSIHMVVNTATNSVTELTIAGNKGTTQVNYTLDEPKSVVDANYTSLALGWYRENYRPTFTTTLQSIKIQEEVSAISYADYIVHFVDESGEKVKDDEKRRGEVGAVVNANSSDQVTIINNDFKYIYKTDNGGVEVLTDGTAELTIVYTKYGKYTYDVRAVNADGEELAIISTVSGYEDETLSLFWSKYVKVGTQWYVSSENTFYQNNITKAGTKDIIYNVSDIAYFIECENMNGVRQDRWVLEENANNSGYRKIRINNYYPTIWTDEFEDGGVFDLALPYNNSNGTSHTYQICTRDAAGNLTKVADFEATNGARTYTLEGIVIPAGCSLAISFDFSATGNTNTNARMDYLTLTPTTASKEITSAGYATYYSPYALDFTETGLSAYIAVAEGNKIAFTEVTSVPANTGVLLKGEEGSYEIPVVATAANNATGNLFVGVTEATQVEAGILVLMNGKQGVGFYKTTEKFYVGANTAYLPGSVAEGRTFIGFDELGETTGVQYVATPLQQDNNVYNLNGQRVEKAQKGLYIMNGKKVVVK